MMDIPIGTELARQFLLLPALRDEIKMTAVGLRLDRNDPTTDEGTGDFQREIGRFVVDHAGIDTLIREVLQASFEVQFFVAHGQQGNDVQTRQFPSFRIEGSTSRRFRRWPGLRACIRLACRDPRQMFIQCQWEFSV